MSCWPYCLHQRNPRPPRRQPQGGPSCLTCTSLTRHLSGRRKTRIGDTAVQALHGGHGDAVVATEFRVNAVSPGFTDTVGARALWHSVEGAEERMKILSSSVPLSSSPYQ